MDDEPLEEIAFYIGRAYLLRIRRLLCALCRADDLSIKEIAARTQLSQSTLTGILQRMERAGLIHRRRDHSDRRVVRVQLTRLGRSLEADVFRVANEVNHAFLRL